MSLLGAKAPTSARHARRTSQHACTRDIQDTSGPCHKQPSRVSQPLPPMLSMSHGENTGAGAPNPSVGHCGPTAPNARNDFIRNPDAEGIGTPMIPPL
eukprot:10202710-Alexandrium_andersonii.AAC.1